MNTRERILKMAAEYLAVAPLVRQDMGKYGKSGYLEKAYYAMRGYRNGVPTKALEKLIDKAEESLDPVRKLIEKTASISGQESPEGLTMVLFKSVRSVAKAKIQEMDDNATRSLLKTVKLDEPYKMFYSEDIMKTIVKWIGAERGIIPVSSIVEPISHEDKANATLPMDDMEDDLSDSFFRQSRTMSTYLKHPNYFFQSKDPATYYRKKMKEMFNSAEKVDLTEDDFSFIGYVMRNWIDTAREYLQHGDKRLAWLILDNVLWEFTWGFMYGKVREQWDAHPSHAKDLSRNMAEAAKLYLKAIDHDNKETLRVAIENLEKLISAQNLRGFKVCELQDTCYALKVLYSDKSEQKPSISYNALPFVISNLQQEVDKSSKTNRNKMRGYYEQWRKSLKKPEDSIFYYHSSMEKVLVSCAVFTMLTQGLEKELDDLKAIHLFRQYTRELIEGWQAGNGDFDFLFRSIGLTAECLPLMFVEGMNSRPGKKPALKKLMAAFSIGLGYCGEMSQSKAEGLLADITLVPSPDAEHKYLASPKLDAYILTLQPLLRQEEALFK